MTTLLSILLHRSAAILPVSVRSWSIHLLSRVYTMLPATCCLLPSTKLLTVCCPSVAGYKGIHVAEIQATCCQATCCSSAQHVAGQHVARTSTCCVHVHVARTKATCCRATCCLGVKAALWSRPGRRFQSRLSGRPNARSTCSFRMSCQRNVSVGKFYSFL